MRDYESIAERVLSRRDVLLAKQRRRHEIFVRCTAVGGSLCACAVIAIGVHLGINRLPKPPIDPSVQSSQADDTTSASTTTTTTTTTTSTTEFRTTLTTGTTVTREPITTDHTTDTTTASQTTTVTTQTTEPFTSEETTTTRFETTTRIEITTTLRSEITTSFTTTETTTTSETTGYQPNSWAEKGIWALYPTIGYTNSEDAESPTVIYTATNVIVNVGRIGEHLATVRLTAYDEFGVQHETVAELYSIDGYDVESVIAVRYAGHDAFYIAGR